MFGVFSTGDLIAIAIAVVSSAVTVGVTFIAQKREDRRTRSVEAWRRAIDRQRRIESYFAGVLLTTGRIQGMTWIFDWKRDDTRAEAERLDLYKTLRHIQEELQVASVNLTLEGFKEHVEMVGELFRNFTEFRRGLSRLGLPNEPENLVQEMNESKKAIESIRERLITELPAILKSLGLSSLRFWTKSHSLPVTSAIGLRDHAAVVCGLAAD